MFGTILATECCIYNFEMCQRLSFSRSLRFVKSTFNVNIQPFVLKTRNILVLEHVQPTDCRKHISFLPFLSDLLFFFLTRMMYLPCWDISSSTSYAALCMQCAFSSIQFTHESKYMHGCTYALNGTEASLDFTQCLDLMYGQALGWSYVIHPGMQRLGKQRWRQALKCQHVQDE